MITRSIKHKRIGYRQIDDQTVFYIDYSQLKGEKLLEAVLFTCHEVEKIRVKTLFFVDLTGTQLNLEAFNYIVDCSRLIQPNVSKSVICGISGVTKYFFNLYVSLTKSKVQICKDYNEAEKLLTS